MREPGSGRAQGQQPLAPPTQCSRNDRQDMARDRAQKMPPGASLQVIHRVRQAGGTSASPQACPAAVHNRVGHFQQLEGEDYTSCTTRCEQRHVYIHSATVDTHAQHDEWSPCYPGEAQYTHLDSSRMLDDGRVAGPNSAGPHTSRLYTLLLTRLPSDAARNATVVSSRHRMMTVRRWPRASVGRYTLGGHLVSRHCTLVGNAGVVAGSGGASTPGSAGGFSLGAGGRLFCQWGESDRHSHNQG